MTNQEQIMKKHSQLQLRRLSVFYWDIRDI